MANHLTAKTVALPLSASGLSRGPSLPPIRRSFILSMPKDWIVGTSPTMTKQHEYTRPLPQSGDDATSLPADNPRIE